MTTHLFIHVEFTKLFSAWLQGIMDKFANLEVIQQQNLIWCFNHHFVKQKETVCVCVLLQMEPRALHMLHKCSSTVYDCFFYMEKKSWHFQLETLCRVALGAEIKHQPESNFLYPEPQPMESLPTPCYTENLDPFLTFAATAVTTPASSKPPVCQLTEQTGEHQVPCGTPLSTPGNMNQHNPWGGWDHIRASAYMPIPGLDAGGVTPELKLRLKFYCFGIWHIFF
jgi:hypothetical protein